MYVLVYLFTRSSTAQNGLSTEYFYEPAVGDLRLQEIRHKVGATNFAAHVYGYQKAGNIKSWAQSTDTNPAKTWAISYDKADQLEAASRTESGAVIGQQAFRFDKSGNMVSKQNGAEISKSTFNNRNQLTAQEAGGWMRVRGVTDEGASVRVKSNGNAFSKAQTDKDKGFFAWVETVPGQNTLSIEATDDSPNANKRTQNFTINVTGQSRSPSYDFNGNMTNNGLGQTYQWDAENRLIKITYADLSSTEFAYDGLSRRTRITEKNAANVTTSDKRYVWSGGNQPAEERDATTNAVTKRFFAEGEQRIGGGDAGFYYYAKDHLGSVREITNSSGAIAARYDFDLWGKRTKISGMLDSEVGYTGHHHHAKSGLALTWYRAYDAELGRWISADPIGEAGGLNLYGYVLNDPINGWDPYGQIGFFDWLRNHLIVGASGHIGDGFGVTVSANKKILQDCPASVSGVVGPNKGAGVAVGVGLQFGPGIEGPQFEVGWAGGRILGGAISVAVALNGSGGWEVTGIAGLGWGSGGSVGIGKQSSGVKSRCP